MKKISRPSELLLRPDQKNAILRTIISRMNDEFDLEIGLIAAEDHLDFMLEILSTPLYNKGVTDAQALFQTHFQNLEIDTHSLLRP